MGWNEALRNNVTRAEELRKYMRLTAQEEGRGSGLLIIADKVQHIEEFLTTALSQASAQLL